MHPSCLKYQQVFWRESLQNQVANHQLVTLTFGFRISSYLACRAQLVVQKATDKEQEKAMMARDFYMDDLLTGGDDPQNLIENMKELIVTLKQRNFYLCKLHNNCLEVLKSIPEDLRSIETETQLSPEMENVSKTLGLYWQAESDVLRFHVDWANKEAVMKRELLSEIHSLFDPMGLVAPLMVTPCRLFQKLCLNAKRH
jgi:Pao retrotransposon peptidase